LTPIGFCVRKFDNEFPMSPADEAGFERVFERVVHAEKEIKGSADIVMLTSHHHVDTECNIVAQAFGFERRNIYIFL